MQTKQMRNLWPATFDVFGIS